MYNEKLTDPTRVVPRTKEAVFGASRSAAPEWHAQAFQRLTSNLFFAREFIRIQIFIIFGVNSQLVRVATDLHEAYYKTILETVAWTLRC
jgi:hypothetical protein